MNASPSLNPVVLQFVEHAGNTTQSFGVGRVIGQIYAYLYFSPDPRNLADMQTVLGISKGSASTAVRQLEQWGAVKKVWVKGDRKDYYQAVDWFGRILKSAVVETIGKRLSSYTNLLQEVEADLAALPATDEHDTFIKDRIHHLRSFQTKAQDVWNSPIVKMLMH
jgi:DNA-binding transcriptional regulator GbsR (MarR family)